MFLSCLILTKVDDNQRNFCGVEMTDLFSSVPEKASLQDVLIAFPHASNELLKYIEKVMRSESPLSVGERELIATYVSALNSCEFCYGAHLNFCRAFGIESDLIEQLIEDFDAAFIEPKLRPLLAYARKLTLNPSRLLKIDAEEVYVHGWDERALFDTVQVCSLFNMMNRIVDGTGVSADTINTNLKAEELEPLRKMKYSDLLPK